MSNLHRPTPWSTDIENLKSLLATDIKKRPERGGDANQTKEVW